MPEQNRCHKFDSDQMLVPNKRNGFGPFLHKFFVPIRVGLIGKKLTLNVGGGVGCVIAGGAVNAISTDGGDFARVGTSVKTGVGTTISVVGTVLGSGSGDGIFVSLGVSLRGSGVAV